MNYQSNKPRVKGKSFFWTYTIADWHDPSKSWVMHPEVAQAVKGFCQNWLP